MNRNIVIAFLLWTIVLGSAAFGFGVHVQKNAERAGQSDEKDKQSEILEDKNRKSIAAGIRAQKAQNKTDAFFQELRADYENDKQNNPGAGCVLDPVSLLRWNQANTQSDGDTASEPDDGMPVATSDAEER